MNYQIWGTHNGELINIKDMTTEHIQNCIKMIKRSKFLDIMEHYETLPEPPPRYVVDYELYKPYLESFKKELASRD